ncbi:helix-turn-helix transcriptional regulator [Paenibacillus roseipurpureus]|uniref:Helix-turn-helix transcriptional regulator n=1 Tax=Paenibacillus roseopurpureus TaxID=2918901 RepID=A0AA96LQN4_9BACL|nr:helix-turn-helix transcriptional regulator [Paenibacillus sp. MBLB1832]WNR45404.1 helix-turn-helix transcriptional regulator [Paenibacillus sp. MBLB1832]
MQNKANEKVLTQIQYNIDLMNDTFKNLTLQLYFDNDIRSLLYSRDEEVFEFFKKRNKLQQFVGSYTNLLHSIVIYNGFNKQYYSTFDASNGNSNPVIESAKRMITDPKRITNLKLEPLRTGLLPQLKQDEFDLFSFALYETSSTGEYNNVLVLNVRPEWLFDNLKAVNRLATSPQSGVFLIDGDGVVYNPEHNVMLADQQFKNELLRHLHAPENSLNTFIYGVGKEKKLITSLNTGAGDWSVVNVQPYSDVVREISQLRLTSLLLMIGFLILSLVASWWISRRLYRPIDGLIQQIKGNSYGQWDGADRESLDELSYLSNVYDLVFEKVKEFQQEQDSKQTIIKSYYIRKLILDSSSFTEQEVFEDLPASGIKIEEKDHFAVCVLKVDDYKHYIERTSLTNQRLMNFAILNITSEIMSTAFRCEAVDMRSDHMVLLLHMHEPQEDYLERVIDLLGRAQETVAKYYKLSFSCSISDHRASYKDITVIYEQALSQIQYRLVFGAKCIVTQERIGPRPHPEKCELPPALEKMWIEAVKSDDFTKQEKCLDEFFSLLETMCYDAIMQLVSQFTVVYVQTIREINKNRLSSVTNYHHVNLAVLEKETLADIRELYLQTMNTARQHTEQKEEIKNNALIETIKEVVEDNYQDLNLSLQEISGMLRMTPDYIGKLFRKTEGISVAEFITDVRLKHALHCLINQQMSIKEIMDRVGFTSETSFFRAFKKKFGTTPKEYRLKRIAQALEE